ncbi:MAG: Stk1 family PASTA domain-containing Ser/Thr kinase, partial [Actinobacteria bacterium]|nr:Stk1 family PASTA domain-containing Ser/Thr kinase [Actinomycetota bacterium]
RSPRSARGSRPRAILRNRITIVVTSAQEALVGQTIDGRYQVLALLARGGMATVYQALDLRLDRVVALKVMHRHLAEDPDFVARFHREAKSAARLTHPHVVAVYDQGTAAGLIYLAMEYIPGRNLRDVIHQFGPLSGEQALVMLEPVLEGLAAAHAAGFVHRDIKPENVLISDDGRVKVADFGLARALSTNNTSATTGLIIGTVAYLSPEQVEHGDADGRSDVYAAGILLYEMVTGDVPHDGDSPLAVAYKHVNSDVPVPSKSRAGIPPEIDALVVTATRRDPKLRYQRAIDFLADVRRVRATLPPARPFTDSRATLVVDSTAAAGAGRRRNGPPASQGRKQPPVPPSRASGPLPVAHPRRRRRLTVTALVALTVAIAAFGGWYLAVGQASSIPTPPVAGLTQMEAEQLLAAAGLTLSVTDTAFSEDVAADLIVSSDPAAGFDVREGGVVGVVVSRGPERFAVPDVRGISASDATEEIDAAGLTVGALKESFDDTVAAGKVIETDPAIGAEVKRDTTVDIVVSKGAKPVPLPDVVGRKAAAAKRILSGAGLDVSSDSKFSEEVSKGDVISMSPKAGTVVSSGSQVSIVTSKGPPPVTVPNLIDSPKNKAINDLKRLGLKARVLEAEATPLDRVYSQDPPAGTQIPKGSPVTIRII